MTEQKKTTTINPAAKPNANVQISLPPQGEKIPPEQKLVYEIAKNRPDTVKLTNLVSAGGNVVLPATPNTVPVIPTDWAKLGVQTGYKPKSAEDLNLWIVGPSGEGKTTFESSIPDTMILDLDKGADGVVGTRAMRVQIRSYEHYMEITQKLIDEGKAGKHVVHRISMDTADIWVDMIKLQLQTEKGVPDITEFGAAGHGWSMIRERCWSRLRELEEAGFVWSCVGHMITKTETNPVTHKERTVIRDAVFPTFSAKIVNSSDFKLTIYCINKEIEKKEERTLPGGQVVTVPCGTEMTSKYYLDSYTTAERQGKGRVAPGMTRKFEIPATNAWDIFVKNYNVAVETAKKQNK